MRREWNLSFVTALHVAVLLLLAGFHVESVASDGPVAIAAHKVSTYRADLYWFALGVNDSVAAHDDGGWDAPIGVHISDKNNRVAVRFGGFTTPIFVESGSAFILDCDSDPSLPGDPTSPVELSLHFDDFGVPGDMVAGPVQITASGEWFGGGEWVSADLNYLHDSTEPIWLQVKWPSTNPFMPKLGGDSGPQTHNSFFGYESDGVDVWKPYPGFEIMLRLNILNNTKDSPALEEDSPIDSFTVYLRDRLPVYPDPGFSDTCVAGHVLNCRVETGSIDNYFCVTSWQDDLESEASEILHVTGGSGGSAPVSVSPRHAEMIVPTGTDTVLYMAIENRGYATLQYEYSDYYGTSKATAGFPMAIVNGSGTIYPGQTDSIVFVIGSSSLDEGDYMEVGNIDFSDSLEVYAPEDVSIYLIVDEMTSAEEVASSTPKLFMLEQNYPNPFNGETTIRISTDQVPVSPRLAIVDVLGRKVAEIAAAGVVANAIYFQWDATDEAGISVPSGLYFYRLKGYGGGWKKMAVIR